MSKSTLFTWHDFQVHTYVYTLYIYYNFSILKMEKGTIRIVYVRYIAMYYNEKLTQVKYKAEKN